MNMLRVERFIALTKILGWMLAGLLMISCASVDLRTVPPVVSKTMAASEQVVTSNDGFIRVMTLNLAHARNDGFHQLVQDKATARANLDRVRSLLQGRAVDVLALQEADAPSFWSGGFDHVAYLGRDHLFGHHVLGVHARGLDLGYGTALMSTRKLTQPLSITFEPEHSITPKGFTISTIRLEQMGDLEIDVVSVHLEVFSSSVRKKQASELIGELQRRVRPLVVMGDFNTEWRHRDRVLTDIVHKLDLQAYDPDNRQMITFPLLARRFDWILVSRHFDFIDYSVLPDQVSDHRAVSAIIRLKQDARLLASKQSSSAVTR